MTHTLPHGILPLHLSIDLMYVHNVVYQSSNPISQVYFVYSSS